MSTRDVLPLRLRPLHLAALAAPVVLALLVETAYGFHAVGGAARSAAWTATALVWVPLALLVLDAARSDASPRPALLAEIAEVAEALRQAERALASGAAASPSAKEAPPPAGKRWGLLLVAGVGVVVLTGALLSPLGAPLEPVHEHVAFHVVVDGERMRFTDPSFDLRERGAMLGHLHPPDDTTLHLEGRPGATFALLLHNAVGAAVSANGLELSHPDQGVRVWPTNATHALRLFVAERGQGFVEAAPLLHVPRDGERLLLVYGPIDERSLDSLQRNLPDPQG